VWWLLNVEAGTFKLYRFCIHVVVFIAIVIVIIAFTYDKDDFISVFVQIAFQFCFVAALPLHFLFKKVICFLNWFQCNDHDDDDDDDLSVVIAEYFGPY